MPIYFTYLVLAQKLNKQKTHPDMVARAFNPSSKEWVATVMSDRHAVFIGSLWTLRAVKVTVWQSWVGKLLLASPLSCLWGHTSLISPTQTFNSIQEPQTPSFKRSRPAVCEERSVAR